MKTKKVMENEDLIKCFDAVGNPFLISFGDLKEALKAKPKAKPEVKK